MLSAFNISKLYEIYDHPTDRLKEFFAFDKKILHHDFWALRGINLEVKPGETLGVIGANGSGKSTLLQVLTGILAPTTGWVSRTGRTAALLELGSGFNPELSGRENVLINGELLGLSRKEIKATLPAIEKFADIGEFIDHPVRTYSSGMYVRLAFSTAIHVEPDILIVDEVLAVGDAAFSSRCIRRFEQLQHRGVTTVLVSHDLSLVKQICNRAIFLQHGKIEAQGSPSDVTNHYVGRVLTPPKKLTANDTQNATPNSTPTVSSYRHGDQLAEITEVGLWNAAGHSCRSFQVGELARLCIRTYFRHIQPDPMVGMLIRTRNGMDVFGTNTQQENSPLEACMVGDHIETEFCFECNLTPQEYTVTAAIQHPDGRSHDWLDDVLTFEVVATRKPAGVADLKPKVTSRKILTLDP